MKTTNRPGGSMAVSLGLALLCAGAPPAFAATNHGTFKLLFSSQQDLVDTWGKLHIAVTPVDWIRQNIPPSEMTTGRSPVGCFPLADGSWEVYSQEFATLTKGAPGKWYEGTNRWKLMRGITTDGVTFSQVETVMPETTGTWTNHLTMAHNPDAGEYLMLKIKNGRFGFAYHEVVPERWTVRIVYPESEKRSPCPINDVSIAPIRIQSRTRSPEGH